MITLVTALWILGAYMAARFMASTGGPRLGKGSLPAYLLILAFWPGWIAGWMFMHCLGLIMRATVWRG